MRSAPVYFDLADTSDAVFDRPIEALLVTAIAFCPLALGAVQPWSEAVYISLALLMALTLAVKLLARPDVPFVRSWTYLPIVVFVALVLLQLMPMPASVVRAVSPHTFEIKHRLLSDLPDADLRLRWVTLSFYPEATLHDLRLLLATICVFVVSLNCVRRVSQIRGMLGAIAIIAAVFALLALAQDALGAMRIYGVIDNPSGRPARSGPFINRSHFGQYMNLSIGAAMGFLLVLVNQHFRRDHHYPARDALRKLRTPELRAVWLLLVMIALGGAAILLSLSRGAMLSAAVAGTVTAAVVVTRRGMHGRGWVIGAIVLCIATIGALQADTVIDRLSQDLQSAQGNRFEMWRDLIPAWKKFPLLGTGLGTHAVVFPMYDKSDLPFLATHAENEYVQLLTETGVIGLSLAAVFIAMIAIATIRAVRGAMSPASSMAMGLMFGLIAVLVHSSTDFGQHVPAVAMLTAVTCALLLNLAEMRWRELGKVSSELPQRGSLVSRIAGVCITLAIGAWLAVECYTTVRAAQNWQVVTRIDADLQSKQWLAGNAQYTDVINAAARAAAYRPRDVAYHYGLNFYRYKSITRLKDEPSGAPRLLPDGVQHYRRIIDELRGGRWLCPTFGSNYILSYNMQVYLPDLAAQAQRDIARGFELSGPDPVVALQWGQVQAQRGDVESAKASLRRAVRLSPSLAGDVTRVCVEQLHRADFALEIVGDEPEALAGLIHQLEKSPGNETVIEQARQRAFDAVIARAGQPEATAVDLAHAGAALSKRKEYDRAVAYFVRALNLDYGQADWRIQLALTYEAMGRADDAVREARLCLRRRPQMPEARDLLARLKAPEPGG